MHKIGSMGHTFGVKVDGTSSRRFLRFLSLTAFQAEGCGGGFAADFEEKGRGFAAGCVEGLWKKVVKKVLKIDRPLAGGFVSLTALRAEGCGLPLCGNAYKVSVTGLAFYVI